MQKKTHLVFLIYVGLAVLLEGLGLPYSRHIVSRMVMLMPGLVVFLVLLTKRHLVWPKTIGALFLAWLSANAASMFFATNYQASFEQVLVYAGMFSAFLYSYRNRDLGKQLPGLILILGVLLSLYSLYLNTPWPIRKIALPIPGDGYSLVYSTFPLHNHLGDFLSMAAIVCLFFLIQGKNKVLNIILLTSFLPLIVLSYSRSAYLSLGLTTVVILFYLIKHRLKRNLLFLILSAALVGSVLVAGLSVTREFGPWRPKVLQSAEKSTLGSHAEYLRQGLLSFTERPVFGVGPGNYIYASQRHTAIPFEWVESGLNLFADQFVEGGLLAGTFFLLIMAKLLRRGQKKEMAFFLFVNLFINFQTDYTSRIFSLMLLFFVLGGLTYAREENETALSPQIITVWAGVALIIFQLMFVHELLYRSGAHTAALLAYPVNPRPYQQLIIRNLLDGKSRQSLFLLQVYEKLRAGDASYQSDIGYIYLRLNEKRSALDRFSQAYYWHPYEGRNLYRQVYRLKKDIEGKDEAEAFARSFLERAATIPQNSSNGQFVLLDARDFCSTEFKKCPYKL